MKKKNKNRIIEQPAGVHDQWGMFVKVVLAHVDPVLASVLLATDFVSFDQGQKVVRVATLKKFMLFQDLFIDQKKVYQEYLDRIFGFQVLLIVEFSKVDDGKRYERQRPSPVESVSASTMPAPTLSTQPSLQTLTGTAMPVAREKYGATNQSIYYKREKSFDVSDVKKWTISNALLECFGGSVKEIIKDTHELDT